MLLPDQKEDIRVRSPSATWRTFRRVPGISSAISQLAQRSSDPTCPQERRFGGPPDAQAHNWAPQVLELMSGFLKTCCPTFRS